MRLYTCCCTTIKIVVYCTFKILTKIIHVFTFVCNGILAHT